MTPGPGLDGDGEDGVRSHEARLRAGAVTDIAALDTALIDCTACPRLVAWREQVAQTRRAAFADQDYWGRPVPGFGPADAAILVVGLAPAAHGANRTGRMFTGDRSGDWLFRSLHRNGLANQPTATGPDDGLQVRVRITAAVHCAPPDNRPTPAERDCCASWLDAEVRLLLPTVQVVVALGQLGWRAALGSLSRCGQTPLPRPMPRFGHGAECTVADRRVIASYHPSQQNTFTGRLTEPMLDGVFQRAAASVDP